MSETENTMYQSLEIKHKNQLSFLKDKFQLDGDKALFDGSNVLVVAGTGCGKSTLAEFAILLGLETKRYVVLTVPVIALALQYYCQYNKQYNKEKIIVGLKTGNHIINPDAQVLIVTAEVLENELNQTEIKKEYENCIVIMDEVHNINNSDRGKVWENTIATLPPKSNILMLSATIDSPEKFTKEISLMRSHETKLVTKYGRTVPLRVKLVNLRNIYKDTNFPRDDDFIEVTNTITKTFDSLEYDKWKREYIKDKSSTFHKLNQLIKMIRLHDGFPAIDFIFSKKMCHKLANSVDSTLLDSAEIAEMKHTLKQQLGPYYNTLQTLECFAEYERLLLKGISYHHSGMLPILRELTEILFRQKKIKLVFATETLAIGVNMPTRSVIFHDFTKPSKNGFVNIKQDSYGQMSGRAGRRGMDTEGTVYICPFRADKILPSF